MEFITGNPADTIYDRKGFTVPKNSLQPADITILNGIDIRKELEEALSPLQDPTEASTLGGTKPSTEPEIG